MIIRIPRHAASAAALAVLVGAAGCGAERGAPDESGAAGDRPQVVASTDVWAGVVRAVAGDAVDVTTIIDDPAADPHSYEASPADAADVADADLVVFNGGGYDEFMTQFLARSENKPTVRAVTVAEQEPHSAQGTQGAELPATGAPNSAQSGGHSHEGGANEHVWYDLPVVAAVADDVAEELGKLEPAQAEQFAAGATRFGAGIDKLAGTVQTIGDQHAGAKVVMTEPVAFYLVEAVKLDDVTPPEFVEAVEEETDPSAAATAATTELLSTRRVQVMIYNPQTETPVTSRIRQAAEGAGIPVVTMTETLPAGTDYLTWMSGQVDQLAAALG